MQGKIYKVDSTEVKSIATSELQKSVAADLLAEDKQLTELLASKNEKKDEETTKDIP